MAKSFWFSKIQSESPVFAGLSFENLTCLALSGDRQRHPQGGVISPVLLIYTFGSRVFEMP